MLAPQSTTARLPLLVLDSEGELYKSAFRHIKDCVCCHVEDGVMSGLGVSCRRVQRLAVAPRVEILTVHTVLL